MMSLQLIQLPREVRAFPSADPASEDRRGCALCRPAKRLLLLSSDWYQGLSALVAACKCACGSIDFSTAVQ